MPEGDTVYRTARRLDTALAGHILTRSEVRVPRFATIDLAGAVVHGTITHGKHLLTRIGSHTLHSHLRMDGAWAVQPRGEKWRHPAFRVRVVLGTEFTEALGVDIAEVAVISTAQEHTLIGHLGPDPLRDDWDHDEALRRLRADARSIHVALIDQRNVAGFGNEYAAELLFLRGILPTNIVDREELEPLLDVGVRTLRANRDRTHRTFTGVAAHGQSNWVYGRAGKPCRRCGASIHSGWIGADRTRERRIFWCPQCQQ